MHRCCFNLVAMKNCASSKVSGGAPDQHRPVAGPVSRPLFQSLDLPCIYCLWPWGLEQIYISSFAPPGARPLFCFLQQLRLYSLASHYHCGIFVVLLEQIKHSSLVRRICLRQPTTYLLPVSHQHLLPVYHCRNYICKMMSLSLHAFIGVECLGASCSG